MATTLEYLLKLRAGDMITGLEKTSKAAGLTEDQLKAADAAAEELSKQGGALAGSMSKLGGVLGRIDPRLEELARFTTDAADAFDVLGSTQGRVLRLMGPAAVAVGVLGVAYLALKADLDKANAAMERAAELADDQIEISRKVKEAKLLEALATGRLTQQEFNRLAAAQDAKSLFETQRTNATERIRLIEQELAVAEKLDRAAADRVLREQTGTIKTGGILAGTSERGQGGATAAVAAEATRATVVQLRNELEAAGTALGIVTEGEQAYAAALATSKNASLNRTDAAKADTEAIKAQTLALADFNAEVDLLTAQAGFRQLATDIDTIGASLSIQAGNLRTVAIDVGQELSAMTGEFMRQAFVEGAKKAAPGVAAAMASGDLSGIVGGVASAFLGTAAGQVIGMATSGLVSLGTRGVIDPETGVRGPEGAELVAEKLESQTAAIERGIAELPDLIIVVWKAIAIDLPIAIAKGLFQALVQWWTSIKDAVLGLSPLKNDQGGDSVLKDILTLDFSRSRDRGGAVQQTGFHMLHAGEEIIRSNGIGSQAGMMRRDSSSGGSVLLVSPSLFPMVQSLDRLTGAGGLRET